MSEGTGVNVIDDTVNVLTQVTTGGLFGFGEEGFKQGVVTEAAVDVTKEVTGAAAAEEANQLAREQFEQDRARQLQERDEALERNRTRQINLSRGAARARGGNISQSTSSVTGNNSIESDFLGL